MRLKAGGSANAVHRFMLKYAISAREGGDSRVQVMTGQHSMRAPQCSRDAWDHSQQIASHGCGAENPAIGRRLLEALAELAEIVPAKLHPAVRGQARATVEQARRSVADPDALRDLEMIAARVMTSHVPRDGSNPSDS